MTVTIAAAGAERGGRVAVPYAGGSCISALRVTGNLRSKVAGWVQSACEKHVAASAST